MNTDTITHERISYYEDGDGYLCCLHSDNFRGWFFVTDNKDRKIRFYGEDLRCPYGLQYGIFRYL